MLSIIIVSYNTRELLRQCLASLHQHAPAAQVIVVDNNSHDGSVAMVQKEFPQVEVVALPANVGFAAANNAGLRPAIGDPIVLLNSDTVVEDDSLDRCAEYLADHPRVGALSPRLIGGDDQPQQCLYAFPTLPGLLRIALWNPPLSETEVADGWLAGAALFLRRQALEEIGGQLDAGYFMYWEDTDLSARLRQRGWQRVVYPKAHVRHFGGSSSKSADAPVKAQLLAWDLFGRHRWFDRYRGPLETAGLWLLDAFDIFRNLLRAWRHRLPSKRTYAWVLLQVLAWRLLGKRPPHPGGASKEAVGRKPSGKSDAPEGLRLAASKPTTRLRVLLIAEMCNPTWTSVPLEGYSLARALAERPDLDVTLVTHVRNRPALAGDPISSLARVHYIDNEWLARPLYRLSTLLRGGRTLSWTTDTAMAWPSYMVFEHQVYSDFRRKLQQGKFDLIHRITPLSPTMGSPLASMTEVPMILGPLNGGLPWPRDYPELRRKEHEWLVPLRGAYKYLPYYRSTYRHLAGVIAGSRHTATEVPRSFRGRRCYIAENGIDPSRLPLAATWPGPSGPFRFLTVGRLVPYKGVDLILEAMQSSAVLRGCELHVIGDGPHRSHLEELARKYQLESCVHFRGWVDHRSLSRELAAAQAFVFPSLREFGGAVVVEALASGLPSIVVEYGGPGELVTPECGILLPLLPRADLVPRLRDAMEKLASNPPLCRTLAQAAVERVRSEFTWQAKAARVVGFYHQVLADASNS